MKANDFVNAEMMHAIRPSWICSAIEKGQAVAAVKAATFLAFINNITLDFEKLFESSCCINDSFLDQF